jgi:phosphoglycerate dehydrogenase-like enzyme
VPSAGVEDEVAIPGLASTGIVLTNGQRLASPEIAEHAMALVRALARRLDRALELQSTARWERSGYRGEGDLLRLRGKTLLVVGLGGIGTEVARLADAAGMTVLATRNSSRTGPEFVAEVGLAEDLDEMLTRADVVVNCLPLTDATRGLFDRAKFRLMPSDALFVNVGRGGTVVTGDLIAALEAGELGGAGLDVTDPEPLPDGHPLWSTPGVIITPHSAAVSDAGWERLWLLFRENLRRFAAGEPLLSVVDIERGY